MVNVESIADALEAAVTVHPVRVGIDGFCASGKTTVANALAARMERTGRQIIRASTDDFQNPPDIRWQLGSLSPEGFARFQIDFSALKRLLLDPLGLGGSRRFRTACYDVHSSRPTLSDERTAAPSAVLLLDGLFLHSPHLAGCFDLTVFLAVDFQTCLSRALARNQECISNLSELEQLYRQKYLPGFELYRQECRPEQHASFVLRT
jgi:uridine kinase